MDVVSLFAIMVFAAAWHFRSRVSEHDPVTRMLLTMLMVVAAGVGCLGIALRLVT